MKTIKAIDVAYLFLNWAKEDGDFLSNLKIQKLLYYAQSWNLVYFNTPLFQDQIEAWVYGPVIANVYNSFKKFGQSPIICEKIINTIKSKFSDDTLEFLKSVYSHYVRFSAHELVNITHNEAPWKETFQENKNNVISLELMSNYYASMLKTNA